MLETDITGAGRILDLTWDEAWAIQERAVARGLKAKVETIPRRIGVDEKSAAKGHRYLTLVCNLDKGNVEYIADERTTESLDGYFTGLTAEQRDGIEAIAMDMWEPFFKSVKNHVPDADDKIVFDKFHIMKHLGEAVDKVRRAEHKQLTAEGDNTLAKSKYLWLYREENLPEWHKERFKELKAANLKTGKAWAIKESLVDFFEFKSKAFAKKHFDKWFCWATHSKLKPISKVAHMIKRHISNVLTFFTHRITNAVCEGLNSKIQTIKKMAYGFRNMSHLKTAIYFHCGGLSLYPVAHSKA
jgi:transposase